MLRVILIFTMLLILKLNLYAQDYSKDYELWTRDHDLINIVIQDSNAYIILGISKKYPDYFTGDTLKKDSEYTYGSPKYKIILNNGTLMLLDLKYNSNRTFVKATPEAYQAWERYQKWEEDTDRMIQTLKYNSKFSQQEYKLLFNDPSKFREPKIVDSLSISK